MSAFDDRIVEYRRAVSLVAQLGGTLAAHDLPALLRDIERAEALGPLLDPTLYRDKSKAMQEDAEMLRAALPLWSLARDRLLKAGVIAKAEGK